MQHEVSLHSNPYISTSLLVLRHLDPDERRLLGGALVNFCLA